MTARKVIGVLCVACMLYSVPGHAFEWGDLWFTPEQRASRQLESQQYDQLIETAPDANWRGLGEYRKGDYAAAAESFAEDRANAEQFSRPEETERAMYNQANAKVLNEQYAEAIELFDEVLDVNPEHQDAKHNRDIAEQLLEQQQQQQQQEQESGEEGEQDQEQQSGEESQDSDQQNSDQQESESGQEQQSDEQSDQQQSDNEEGEASDEQQSAGASQDELSEQEQEAQAAEALAAEQEAQEGQEQSEQEAAQDGQQEVDAEPLTEREQANEQWLRKIPDDPAGLLQRKIQNRHLTDYPKVNDSDKPW